MNNFFLELSMLFGITVSAAFVMRLLRQPLVVAYIVAGLIAGPLFLNITHGEEAFFSAFAEFGIVLLLFLVGLSLNFNYVKRVGKQVFLSGTLQFLATALVGFLIMRTFHFSLLSSLFVSIAITYSSTIIVIKLLTEKKDLQSVYGRFVIGLLIVQDIIAVFLLLFLNTLEKNGPLLETIAITAVKGLLVVGTVFFLSKYLLPKIMDHIASSSEMLFIFTIAWCFGLASLVHLAGFGIEIGAVIAGVSLGSSQYQREIISKIRPLRDFFIVLFFIVLGSELRLGEIGSAIKPGLLLSLFVLIVDPIILYTVMRWMRYTRRNAFLAAVTAAQVSEFGFIVIFKAGELGYVGGTELAILTITALTTIFVSSYLITYNEQLYRFLLPFLKKFGRDGNQQKEEKEEHYEAFVIGYHRIGWKVCEALEEKKIQYAVIDFDPEAVSKLKHRGIPVFFGDVADVEFLDDLPLEKAKLIISTIPEADDQLTLIQHIRNKSEKPVIIANSYHNKYLDDLYSTGANYVMMPHLLGGQWIAEILNNEPWTKHTFLTLKKTQKQEMKLRFTVGADKA